MRFPFLALATQILIIFNSIQAHGIAILPKYKREAGTHGLESATAAYFHLQRPHSSFTKDQQILQKRVVNIPKAVETSCKGRLQKRGQCVSSQRPKKAQNNQRQSTNQRNDRNTSPSQSTQGTVSRSNSGSTDSGMLNLHSATPLRSGELAQRNGDHQRVRGRAPTSSGVGIGPGQSNSARSSVSKTARSGINPSSPQSITMGLPTSKPTRSTSQNLAKFEKYISGQDQSSQSSLHQGTRTQQLSVLEHPKNVVRLTKLQNVREAEKLFNLRDPRDYIATRQNSAPSLVDLPSLKAFSAKAKARTEINAYDALRPGINNSMNLRREMARSMAHGPAARESRIQHLEKLNTEFHTYSRQTRRLSQAFAKAGDASKEANWSEISQHQVYMKAKADAKKDYYNSIAKSTSYLAQIERTKRRSDAEKTRLRGLVDPSQGDEQNVLRALEDHKEATQNDLNVLDGRWRNAERLVDQFRVAKNRVDSHRNREGGGRFPLTSVSRHIAEPFTPSPSTSRGGSETEGSPRRMLDTGSSSD